jgi:competence protein ComEC
MATLVRLAFALTLTVSVASTALAQLEDRVVPSDRVTSFVFIRTEPDSASAERGRLHVGESIPLIGSIPRWYEVQLPDGTTGFMSKAWTRVAHALTTRQEDELRIHFLNIGAGNCAIVECPGPNAPTIIADCGTLEGASTDMTPADVLTYVQNLLSTTSVRPQIVISHAHRDHYSFIPTVLASTQADQIWQGGDPAGYTFDGFPDWIDEQRTGGATIHANQPAHFHNDGQPLGESLSCGAAETFVLTVNTGQSVNARSLADAPHRVWRIHRDLGG